MARFATPIGGDTFDPSVMDLQQGLTTAVKSGLIQYDATGIFSKDGLGNDTFRINSIDGDAFFKGSLLVGSSVPAASITGQLTDAQLAAIAASKVTGQIADSQIAAMATSKLTGQVVSAQLADLAVTTQKLADAAVGTVKIGDGQVTAQKISVAQLSAIAADIGTITAGVMRGAAIETSASNPKVRMDTTGLFVTDSGGNKLAQITSSGGVQFLAPITSAPSQPEIVSWYDVNNKLAAQVVGKRNSAIDGRLSMFTESPDLTSSAELILACSNSTGNALIQSWLNGVNNTILDSQGNSRFLQLLGADQKVKITWGTVASAQNLAANADGTWSPSAATLGLTTIIGAMLGLTPDTNGAGCSIRFIDMDSSPRVGCHNGGTAQTWTGSYIALGT